MIEGDMTSTEDSARSFKCLKCGGHELYNPSAVMKLRGIGYCNDCGEVVEFESQTPVYVRKTVLLDTWIVSKMARRESKVADYLADSFTEMAEAQWWVFPAHRVVSDELASIRPKGKIVGYLPFYASLARERLFGLEVDEITVELSIRLLSEINKEIKLPVSSCYDLNNRSVSFSGKISNSIIDRSFPAFLSATSNTLFSDLYENHWSGSAQSRSEVFDKENSIYPNAIKDAAKYAVGERPDASSPLFGPAGKYMIEDCLNLIIRLASLCKSCGFVENELEAVPIVASFIESCNISQLPSIRIRSRTFSFLYEESQVWSGRELTEVKKKKIRSDFADANIMASALQFADTAVLDIRFCGMAQKVISAEGISREIRLVNTKQLDVLADEVSEVLKSDEYMYQKRAVELQSSMWH